YRLRRVAPAQLEGVPHVIVVGVGDEHRVEPVELLAALGAGGIVLHPGIDEHDLAAGKSALDRGVAEIGELRARMLAHSSPSLLPRILTGTGAGRARIA